MQHGATERDEESGDDEEDEEEEEEDEERSPRLQKFQVVVDALNNEVERYVT